MKILHVGIFNDHCLGGDIIFNKGFALNNHNVKTFDYRKIANDFGIEKMNLFLIDESCHVDLVFIGKGELIYPNTLKKIRKMGVLTALWYGDIRTEPEKWLIENLKHIDCFFMSSGGDSLKYYHNQGNPTLSAYYFNPCDPDLYDENYLEVFKYDILFTGGANQISDDFRLAIIHYLNKRNDVYFIGGAQYNSLFLKHDLLSRFQKKIMNKYFIKKIRGHDYINAIRSAKIGIGVNAIQNIPKYTSDRLTHYIGQGCFYLSSSIPCFEQIFSKTELITFKTQLELDEKISIYLKDDDKRNELRIKAMKKMHSEYNTKEITKMMIEIINNHTSNRFEWIEIYK